MADSLDDFFAKKDKSKKKGKSKYTADDLLAKQEEKPKKSTKKKKEEKQQVVPDSSLPGENEQTENKSQPENKAIPHDDEEWSEYVEEKETDYSGLRIQSIQIRDDDDKEDKEKTAGGDGDEEEGEEKADSQGGAWKSQNAPAPKPVETPVKKEEPEAAPLPNVKSGKYVPPGLRNQSAATEVTPSRAQMRRKKEAPNIQSEEDFPTLGGPAPEEHSYYSSGARFEKVRSGGRQVDDHSSRGPRLELGNKYDALRGGDD